MKWYSVEGGWWVVDGGWSKGEDFGVADGGGGRLWWGVTSRTTEWLTEDERVGTSAWGLYPIHRDHWWIQMNTPVYLVPIALPPPSASWHFNRKRNPWDSNDPCGAKVRDPSIFMHMNSTKSADKLEIYPLHDLLCFWFYFTELDLFRRSSHRGSSSWA